MYTVYFKDNIHGDIEQDFDTFAEASEYWQEYADTPSCVQGELFDRDANEIIWCFSEPNFCD